MSSPAGRQHKSLLSRSNPRPDTPRCFQQLNEASLPISESDSKMPYYVVPVLYVPKRKVPTEEKHSHVGTHIRHSGGEPKALGSPDRLPRARTSLNRPAKHLHQFTGGTAHHHSLSKNNRPTACGAPTYLAKVAEESEDIIEPTRDTARDTQLPIRSSQPEKPAVETNKLPEIDTISEPTTAQSSSSKRDDTIHEVRIRLLEALQMVEIFQQDRKKLETKATQCEYCAAFDECTHRPFNHISRLEALLKQMRK